MLKGLRLKFGLVILCLAVLWLALSIYLSFFHSQSGTKVRSDRAAAAARVLATAVAPAVQKGDAAALDEMVGGLLTGDKEVAYVKVQDRTGATLKEAGSAGAGVVSASRKVESGGAELGTLTLGLNMPDETGLTGNMSWFPFTAALALFSLLVLLVGMNRMVLYPLGRMHEILKGMAEGSGDLTQRADIKADDEIGAIAANLNVFIARLREMVRRAQSSSARVLDITNGIGDKTRSFITSAQEQAKATNDNFKALERMDVSVQDVAGSAESLSITSTDSSATVTEMSAQVDVVADSTIDLSGHVEEAFLSINEMTDSIKEVGENVKALADLASETAGAVGRIEESIKEVEARSKRSAALSQQVLEDADILGNQAIARTIEGIDRIRETVEETSGVIESLGARSQEIGQIVKVIDEVTNQTSLLALNAAILAAQAGEHGKGFAVVANEIKDLAERTSTSTGEITRLIKSVQQGSQDAVEAMRLGRERVTEGAKTAYSASDSLSKILESANMSRETAAEIERATSLQVAAVRQVADAMKTVYERTRGIEKATQEQIKGGDLITSAAGKMSDIAKEVRKAMAEQARAIKDFARSLEETKDTVDTIANATKNQSEDSSGLVGSMEKFLEIAQDNSAISAEMEIKVVELLQHAESLREEMGRFKI